MWWNFVGRSHEEIVEFRREWQEQITSGGAVVADSQQVSPGASGSSRTTTTRRSQRHPCPTAG